MGEQKMTTRRATYEIGAVIVTALLHPVFVDVLHQRAVFIALALVSWASYLGVRAWREANLLTELGFRKPPADAPRLGAEGVREFELPVNRCPAPAGSN